jgi:hypothetical protein
MAIKRQFAENCRGNHRVIVQSTHKTLNAMLNRSLLESQTSAIHCSYQNLIRYPDEIAVKMPSAIKVRLDTSMRESPQLLGAFGCSDRYANANREQG